MPPARIAAIQPPIVPIVGRLIESVPGTISLGQGMVGYGPPPGLFRDLDRVVSTPDLHRYGPVEGVPELVSAIEAKLLAENRIEVAGSSVAVVTAGGNMAFMNAVLAVTDPGDEIVLPVPYYFNHEMAIVMAGCRAVTAPTDASYQIDVPALERAITARTRAIVTVSPNNPTGAVYGEARLREVNALCASRGLFHIHDEAYEYFTFDGRVHFSPGSLPGAGGHTISLYSLSKAYGLAGWRVGYMVAPAELADAINKIQDTILICPPGLSQQIALRALEVGPSHCRRHLPALDRARRALIAELERARDVCEIPAADGAMYLFLRIHTRLDAMTLTERLIREHRIAVLPGSAFGLEDGCYLRVSFGALDEPTAREAGGRLAEGLLSAVMS